MARSIARPALRLLGNQLRTARRAWRGAVALSRRRDTHAIAAAVRGRPLCDRRWTCAPDLRRLGAVPRTAQSAVSAGAQYRADRGTLAHAHQHPPRTDF